MVRVESAFAEIATGMRQMANQVDAISSAAGEQRLAVADAARLLEQVAVTAETNRAAMDETIGMVGALSTMAGNLSALVENFHVQ